MSKKDDDILAMLYPLRHTHTLTIEQIAGRRHIRDALRTYLNRQVRGMDGRDPLAIVRAKDEISWATWAIKTLFPGKGWD